METILWQNLMETILWHVAIDNVMVHVRGVIFQHKAISAGELFSNEAISVAFCVVLKKAKDRPLRSNAIVYIVKYAMVKN